VEKVAEDTDRDRFMGGEETMEYGLVDASVVAMSRWLQPHKAKQTAKQQAPL